MTMKIILISAAIFTFMILADEMPRFHNDDLVNFYQRNCNESVYNETLVAMDKCLFKKAGKVITEVVSLRDFRLKPTKMKCESIQSWFECFRSTFRGCFYSTYISHLGRILKFYNFMFSIYDPDSFGGHKFIEECPFILGTVDEIARMATGADHCSGLSYMSRLRKTVKCEKAARDAMEEEAEFAEDLSEEKEILVESVCRGYKYMNETCWPLLTPCLSEVYASHYKTRQGMHFRGVEQEVRRTVANFTFEESCQ